MITNSINTPDSISVAKANAIIEEAYHKLGTEKVKSLRFVKKSIENALISLESDKTIE